MEKLIINKDKDTELNKLRELLKKELKTFNEVEMTFDLEKFILHFIKLYNDYSYSEKEIINQIAELILSIPKHKYLELITKPLSPDEAPLIAYEIKAEEKFNMKFFNHKDNNISNDQIIRNCSSNCNNNNNTKISSLKYKLTEEDIKNYSNVEYLKQKAKESCHYIVLLKSSFNRNIYLSYFKLLLKNMIRIRKMRNANDIEKSMKKYFNISLEKKISKKNHNSNVYIEMSGNNNANHTSNTNINNDCSLWKTINSNKEVLDILNSDYYYEFNFDDYIYCFTVLVNLVMRLNISLTFYDKDSILLMFYCNNEIELENKAEKHEYYLQLKNYAAFYKDYERKFLAEHNKQFENNNIRFESTDDNNNDITHLSEHYDNTAGLINTNNNSANAYNYKNIKANALNTYRKFKDRLVNNARNEYNRITGKVLIHELDENIITNFPPFMKFEKLKSEKFRVYSYNDCLYQEVYDNNFDYEESNSSSLTKFRMIDRLRLIKSDLDYSLAISYLTKNKILKNVIYERKFNQFFNNNELPGNDNTSNNRKNKEICKENNNDNDENKLIKENKETTDQNKFISRIINESNIYNTSNNNKITNDPNNTNNLNNLDDVNQNIITNVNTINTNKTVDNSKFNIKSSLSFNPVNKKSFINFIRNILGEQLSFYLLYLNHSVNWMLFPVLLGLFYSIIDIIYKFVFKEDINDSDSSLNIRIVKITAIDFASFIFCFLLTIWATLLLNTWKQKEKMYAYFWGTDHLSFSEPNRPDFEADYEEPLMFDHLISKVKPWKRNVKYAVSYSACFIMMLINLFLIYLINYWKFLNIKQDNFSLNEKPIITSNDNIDTTTTNNNSYFDSKVIVPMIAGGISAIQIWLLATIYRYIALKLNHWENHKTDSSFLNNLRVKYFVFEFFNNYTTLFYIAFMKESIEGCLHGNCYYELQIQIYSQLVATFFIDIVAVIYPLILAYINKKFYLYKVKGIFSRSNIIVKSHNNTNAVTTNNPQLAEIIDRKESIISNNTQQTLNTTNTLNTITTTETGDNIFYSFNPVSNVKLQLFKNQFSSIELIITNQKILIIFGYACFFSVACPFVPLILALVLYVDQYLFSYMLLYLNRVTIIESSAGIGIYNKIFKIFYVVGMITNVAVVFYSSPYLKYKSSGIKAVLFILVENIIFFLMNYVNYNILPEWFDDHLNTLKELYNKQFYDRENFNLPHKYLREEDDIAENDAERDEEDSYESENELEENRLKSES